MLFCMIPIQLEFFKTPEQCELETLHKAYRDLKTSTDKVRRGMYARLGELTKANDELKERLNVLEKHICCDKAQVVYSTASA